mmetsp:Transcript_16264/g.42208  ORF Transcript_16264/g.42208 Transcript_16264/m.42208 type:complete len:124 (-) Transcript_16264:233-604(-)
MMCTTGIAAHGSLRRQRGSVNLARQMSNKARRFGQTPYTVTCALPVCRAIQRSAVDLLQQIERGVHGQCWCTTTCRFGACSMDLVRDSSGLLITSQSWGTPKAAVPRGVVPSGDATLRFSLEK